MDGLASTLLSFKKAPVIRYAAASDVCKKVATELTARTKEVLISIFFSKQNIYFLIFLNCRRMDSLIFRVLTVLSRSY